MKLACIFASLCNILSSGGPNALFVVRFANSNVNIVECAWSLTIDVVRQLQQSRTPRRSNFTGDRFYCFECHSDTAGDKQKNECRNFHCNANHQKHENSETCLQMHAESLIFSVFNGRAEQFKRNSSKQAISFCINFLGNWKHALE